MSSVPSLGVVSVTYNAAAHLETFLKCVSSQTHDNFQLLIIDNSSSDSTVHLIEGHQDSRIHLLKNETNVGYAAACNQGIAYFQKRNALEILFINNDTEFGPDLFRALANERAAHNAHAIVPRITLASDTRLNWYAGGRFVFWKAFQAEMVGENRPNDASDKHSRLTPVAPGCCILFTMQTLQTIGAFDEVFFVYFEDTDYCLRMSYAGRTLLYAPGISLVHKVSSTTGGPVSAFSVRYYNRNQAYILRKHFALPIVALQLPLILAKAALRLILRRDTVAGFLLRLRSTWEGLWLPLPVTHWKRFRVPKPVRLTQQKDRGE